MIGREVELGDVVSVALDLRALVDRVAEAVKEIEQLVADPSQDVPVADPRAPPRQRDVDRLSGFGCALEHQAPRRLDLGEPALDEVEAAPAHLAGLDRE